MAKPDDYLEWSFVNFMTVGTAYTDHEEPDKQNVITVQLYHTHEETHSTVAMTRADAQRMIEALTTALVE